MLLLAWSLGAAPGIGTVGNAVSIGLFVVAPPAAPPRPRALRAAARRRLALLGVGLLLFGIGTALYIGAGLGAGPRDSLMLVGARRLHCASGRARVIEISVLVVGFLLGGVVGIGTVLFAALIGPAVEASFWLLSRTALTR